MKSYLNGPSKTTTKEKGEAEGGWETKYIEYYLKNNRETFLGNKYRASTKGALAKGPLLLRGPIHGSRFSMGTNSLFMNF